MQQSELKDKVHLISDGLPQFLDFEVTLDDDVLKKVFYFYQEKLPVIDKYRLHVLDRDNEGDYKDQVTGESYTSEPEFMVKINQITPWIDKWLPLPFFLESREYWDSGDIKYSDGPVDWARARITKSDKEDKSYFVTLAFDMTTQPLINGRFVGLPEHSNIGPQTFSLAYRYRDNGWFLNEEWVDGWLKDYWEDFFKREENKKGRSRLSAMASDPEEEFRLAYLANYLVFLEFVSIAVGSKKIVVDNSNNGRVPPIEVDLVLDIGNSRSTGLLVETKAQKKTNLNSSYRLQLRDLSIPHLVHSDPFDTRIEFCKASFGHPTWSARNRADAFNWPSPVRTGPEACRLASNAFTSSGTSGMSSPKRYLWDERQWEANWVWNPMGEEQGEAVIQSFALNSYGIPLCCSDNPKEPRFKQIAPVARVDDDISFLPTYSRSSMMMLLLMEIISQALLTINNPKQRYTRESEEVPRHLRKVVLTMPAGMPVAEQKIFRRWVEFAIRTLWDALGWKGECLYVPQGSRLKPLPNGKYDYRARPEVVCEWDEATCTQLVYLYNEIIRNYSGDAQLFFEQKGKKRNSYQQKPAVRVATIDMGGGTTDFSVTTYVLENSQGESISVAPNTNIRDGFSIAGDDVLKVIIHDIVLKSIISDLVSKGNEPERTEKTVKSLFDRNKTEGVHRDQFYKSQFTKEVLIPVALAVMERYERFSSYQQDEKISFRFRDIFIDDKVNRQKSEFTSYEFPAQKILDYIKKANPDLSVMDVVIDTTVDQVSSAIKSVVSDTIKVICEVVRALDTDVLLLTGRPSCWPALKEIVTEQVCVAPGRLIPMKTYNIGSWYPFSDVYGNITDPKTTVAVGGILCSLALNDLESFSFDPSNFKLTSIARHIGELEPDGSLRNAKIWFNVDPEVREEKVLPTREAVQFVSPISIGYRQLDVERWPATKVYRMEYKDSEARRVASGKTPYRIRLELALEDINEDSQTTTEGRSEGQIDIVEIEDKNGNPRPKSVVIRLQTLNQSDDDGYWVDTGDVCSQ